MNTADLLSAVFADHEAEAPDVTDTRLRIEARLAARTQRRRTATPLAVGGAAATVAAIAIAASLTGTDQRPGTAHPGGALRPTASVPQPSSSSPTPARTATATTMFPFRAGWVPAGATIDHAEVGHSGLYLEGYTFGTFASAERGLTLWTGEGPLPTRLRDGGTLNSTTVRGRPAVEGWSPRSRSYTVSILRPDKTVMTVLAYGFDRSTATGYATQTARDVEYGNYPPPVEPS